MPTHGALLRIYLNDHLAAAGALLAVAHRTLRSNPDGELGRFLAGVAAELEDDRAALEGVLRSLGERPNPAKVGLARVAAQAGRLKLNGRVRGYSDLSRVLELEGLQLGAALQAGTWRSLARTGRELPVDADELAQRAERRAVALEAHRLAAADRAFGSPR